MDTNSFIDGDKLLNVVNSVTSNEELLSIAERKRNERGRSATYAPERENGASEAVYPPLVEAGPRRMSQNRRNGGGRGQGRNGGRGGRGGRSNNRGRRG